MRRRRSRALRSGTSLQGDSRSWDNFTLRHDVFKSSALCGAWTRCRNQRGTPVCTCSVPRGCFPFRTRRKQQPNINLSDRSRPNTRQRRNTKSTATCRDEHRARRAPRRHRSRTSPAPAHSSRRALPLRGNPRMPSISQMKGP